MTHHDMSAFAQSWGLVYLVGLFVAVVIYAAWPANGRKFDRAARMPLDDND